MTAPEPSDVRPVPGAREADLVWARTASVEEILEFVGGRVDHELLGELLRARLDQVQVEAFERGSAAAIAEERPAHNEARAEVERQRDLAQRNFKQGAALLVELQAAEAKLRDMEALAEHWRFDGWATYEGREVPRQDGWTLDQCAHALRDVLARSQARQAPAEQECGLTRDGRHDWYQDHRTGVDWFCGACGKPLPAPSVRPDTADDEGVRRG